MIPKISISSLIFKSPVYADSVWESVHKFTPELHNGEAEFFFIANDPTYELIEHLKEKNYKYYININPHKTLEELSKMGYVGPEYIHRVYRGWNEVFKYAKGDIIVSVNSDMHFGYNWLKNLIKHVNKNTIVTSRLIERKNSIYSAIWPGAIQYDFGSNPINFEEDKFLLFSKMVSINDTIPSGAFMPCAIYWDVGMSVGLYPEGNLISGRPGDLDFFYRLNQNNVKHITAMDSIVYHYGEGELTENFDRSEYINYFIKNRKYNDYLELGVLNKLNFNKIHCSNKTSVDLNYDADYKMSTDDFFKINKSKYDIIFIDANHIEEFLTRDILNSLNALKAGGVIICHDCNPPDENSQKDENYLYQTAWKAFVKFRNESKYLTYCLPYDCGLGIIDTRYPNCDVKLDLPENLQYIDLEKNRNNYLGIKYTPIL
jgi:ribosomal protein L7Ae-like RNA K-turn-binding protein